MKRKVVDVDFNLLKECCSEQGMELIPATSEKYIELTDEHGNKYKVMPSDNIFETETYKGAK